MSRMTRLFAVLISLASSFAPATDSKILLPMPDWLRLEGRVVSEENKVVHGAEVRLLDPSGKSLGHVYSDLDGRYRFPSLQLPAETSDGFRLETSHVHYQTLRVNDIFTDLHNGLPVAGQQRPIDPLFLPSAAKTVRRDLILKRSSTTSQFPAAGPLDFWYAEGIFHEALSLIERNLTADAVRKMRIYAQIGGNPKEIARALQFLEIYDK